MAAAPPGDETRKTVSILFADIADSTPLAAELDAESLRRLMLRYFDEMKLVVERHGGVVEKFIGDAVMAVFGIPRRHEDDPLRAVRAAAEMRATLVRLNQDFEQAWGVTLSARIGVETGEVVVGGSRTAGELYVTGEAVTLAARLEQAARPNEILVGERTYRLVREALIADPVPPLTLKGKEEPTPAWSVVDVIPHAPGLTRRLGSPLVGRDQELEWLSGSFRRAVESEPCQVVTVLGAAGVGKSRLTVEFVTAIRDRATVVTGRCLPYGEGITFWPVAALLRDAAGIVDADAPDEARVKLRAVLPDDENGSLIAERLAALLGIGGSAPGIQETFWAVRKLLETLAARRPLVAVIDDIQWGEPTFLDLLEYLADWIRAAPVLLVCLARPDLLTEVRPAWMTGKPNASLMSLQPLSEVETRGLIENLVGGTELAGETAHRITAVAEGNPLFVEETLRMFIDDGRLEPKADRWVVSAKASDLPIPPNIHALLAARLDRLDPDERGVIERASVIGRVFAWRAVSELTPPELRPMLVGNLQSLMRKELIRPDFAEIAGEDAFRFAHILIRDAAYQGISKAIRAELHERLAEWIDMTTRDRAGEYEEIVGYHLEQAYGAILDLGPPTQRSTALARRAAERLASAGSRAFDRGDMPASVKLLTRATSLLDADAPERLALLPQLAYALMELGDFERVMAVAGEASEAAAASEDPGLQAKALILDLLIRFLTDPEGWAEEAQREATRAISVFRELGDDRGLAKGWSLFGYYHLMKAQFASAEKAWQEAASHANRAGDHRDEQESLAWVPLTIWAGPTHADEGLRRCREILSRAEGDKKTTSSALIAQAAFEAGLGRFDEARRLIGDAKALLSEVELTVWMAGPLAQLAGWVELLANEPAAAERELRAGYRALEEIGERAWLSTVAGILAQAVLAQGRDKEAEQLADASRESASAEDAYSQVLWRTAMAQLLARRAESAEAERVAREAVSTAEGTDFLHLRWHARMTLAEVLRSGGRAREAAAEAERAGLVAEQKGSVVGQERARELRDALGQVERV